MTGRQYRPEVPHRKLSRRPTPRKLKPSGRGELRLADGATSACEYELEPDGRRFRLEPPPPMFTTMHALVAATLTVEEGHELAGNFIIDLVGIARFYISNPA